MIEENFGHKKLVELITMDHEQSITTANALQVMMVIIDGDTRMPTEIAEEHGFVGGPVTTDEVRNAVTACINDPNNVDIVNKIMGGNDRPIMALVGRVMKAVNRRGDPVVIKQLLTEQFTEKRRSGTWQQPTTAKPRDSDDE